MPGRFLLGAILCLSLSVTGRAGAKGSSNTAASLPEPGKPASFEQRLAAARSVKVKTDILGIKVDSPVEKARALLATLGTKADSPQAEGKEAEDDNEGKEVWQLTKSDFSAVSLKSDAKGRVIYLLGFIRPGKEIPFQRLGQTEKAPVLTANMVAWDVAREGHPLIRVVASGQKQNASSFTVFVVKRLPSL
ncbi:MAG: hypothetical protein H0X40_06895 [Chthoniobacterales bacterium]|nr:hypothetical protein [Chthoniobacterales bacterium]